MTSPTVTEPGPEPTMTGGSRRKRLLLGLVVLAALAAGAYWFVLRPSGPAPPPKPGEVVSLEPIQVNLAGGHYLRLGLALQLTETAHEADGSKALDAAIDLFSGWEMADLTRSGQREELKHELETELEELYHGEVMAVYFTEFVTQ